MRRQGLVDPLMTALSCCPDLDLQLASKVLLELEDIALGQQQEQQQPGVLIMPATVLGRVAPGCRDSAGVADEPGAAAAAGKALYHAEKHLPLQFRQQQQLQLDVSGSRRGVQDSTSLAAAVSVTIRHLAQQEAVPQSEAVIAWRALRSLCWCQTPAGKEAARSWLQKLIAAALNLALEGTIPLPLPAPVPATTPSPSASAHDPCSGCNLLQDLFTQLTTHCPGGPELLVDAVQLHVTTEKAAALQQQPLSTDPLQHVPSDASAGPGIRPVGVGTVAAERARAAAARAAVQGWVLVLQWVLAGNKAHCKNALQQLAEMALRMACVDMMPLQLLSSLNSGDLSCSSAPFAFVERENGPVTGASGNEWCPGDQQQHNTVAVHVRQYQPPLRQQQGQHWDGRLFQPKEELVLSSGEPMLERGETALDEPQPAYNDVLLSCVPFLQGFLVGLQEVPEVST
jgi:hypothetical protein